MSDVNDLFSRIDGALAAVKDKAKAQQQKELKHYQDQQKRLKDYEAVQAKIVEIAKPRLQALAQRAGDRATVTPQVAESRRGARFDFKSPKAHLTLTFTAAPDKEILKAVVACDLKIIPVLWMFDAHTEFSSPIAAFDGAAFTKWLDDRIIGFVELYLQIHETELYDNADYVEDPIAKVKFPKFAAGALLEHGGQTYFFIDDTTKAEFAKQKGIAAK